MRAAGILNGLVLCIAPAAFAQSAPVSQFIGVGVTEPGLASGSPYYISGSGQHYVNASTTAKPVLVVFLGGTGSTPADYTNISDAAADPTPGNWTNFASIGLAYINGSAAQTIGGECGRSDQCFSAARGESAFGKGVVYPGTTASYDATQWQTGGYAPTPLGDSIVSRLIFLIDYLSWTGTSGPGQAYWRQFLKTDNSAAPVYVSPHNEKGQLTYSRKVVPAWGKIIIAGHSQGGGDAAFLAMTVPKGVRRAVLFSAPQDNTDGDLGITTYTPGDTACWMTDAVNATTCPVVGAAKTPLAKFWGLRNASVYPSAEGVLGNNVFNNWHYLNAANASGGLGGKDNDTDVGTGATPPPKGHQALYIDSPHYATDLGNHNSTAVNGSASTAIVPTWRWMFSGGGTDN